MGLIQFSLGQVLSVCSVVDPAFCPEDPNGVGTIRSIRCNNQSCEKLRTSSCGHRFCVVGGMAGHLRLLAHSVPENGGFSLRLKERNWLPSSRGG